MYELIGMREEYTPDPYNGGAEFDEVEEVVATFDKEADAYEYIEKSRLKNPRHSLEVFRQKSLLGPYTEAEVRPGVSVPHNPII